jgi:hypothetical protein
MLDIYNYLNEIHNYDYAITKTDVPYMPNNFPLEYPIGKDLDIFISKKDFDLINNTTYNYFNKYNKLFDIKKIKTINNFKLRLEKKNKLHFQIDITINDDLIKNKLTKDNYYILSLDNEIIVRTIEIKKNPQKIHHKIWLEQYNK